MHNHSQAVLEREAAEGGLDLDPAAMDALLSHAGAETPVWICVACRELAAAGDVTSEQIERLPDDIHR